MELPSAHGQKGGPEIDISTEKASLAAQFSQNGFVRLPRLCDESELAWVGEIFDKFFSEGPGRASIRDIVGAGDGAPEMGKLPQVLLPEREVPELLDGEFVRNARSWASVLLDIPADDLEYFGNLVLKQAHEESVTPWHQDEAYFDPKWRRRAVTLWMPLGDATEDNGCLRYVAGSHLGGVVPHRHVEGNDDAEGLEAESQEQPSVVSCPVLAGEASAHDVRTLHSAGPNRTAQPRRAYVHLFAGPGEIEPNPQPRPWQKDGQGR